MGKIAEFKLGAAQELVVVLAGEEFGPVAQLPANQILEDLTQTQGFRLLLRGQVSIHDESLQGFRGC